MSIRRSFVSLVLVAILALAAAGAPRKLSGADLPPTVAYRMPADAQLTLGLFDPQGRLLRWVVQDEFRPAGDHREPWDGLDQWRHPLPAGRFVLKAAYHPPLATQYKMTVCNPGNPPWPTPDDKGDWLSDEADPQAVVSDGKWVFLGAPGCELGYSVIGLDERGQRQWGIRVPFNPRCVSLALDGDYLDVLYSGPGLTDGSQLYDGTNAIGRAILMCLDKRTGRPARFTGENPHLRVATWPYRQEVSWLWDLREQQVLQPGQVRRPAALFPQRRGRVDRRVGTGSGRREALRLALL